MKLNPADLEVISFDTSDALSDAGVVTKTLLPTPCTVCLVCD